MYTHGEDDDEAPTLLLTSDDDNSPSSSFSLSLITASIEAACLLLKALNSSNPSMMTCNSKLKTCVKVDDDG